MLDMYNYKLYDSLGNETITKLGGSQCSVTKPDGTIVTYMPEGYVTIRGLDGYFVFYGLNDGIGLTFNGIFYRIEKSGVYQIDASGGKIKVEDTSGLPTLDSFEEIMAKRSLRTYDEAAERLVNHISKNVDWLHAQSPVRTFTSDYALYWFDYLGGYDVVLAQMGWNQTTPQDIALVRGAANLQNKEWGAMITWKYTHPPYLASGEEIYRQMSMAYGCGAKYIAVFDYVRDSQGAHSVLQDEHFEALHRFWNDVVNNPDNTHGGIKAEAALVLPRNYGWGMRNPTDTIWGLWNANSTSYQVWTQVQNKLSDWGSRLDIVYDDSAYQVAGKYSQVYYWNATS